MALCHTDASGRKNIEDVIRSFAGRGLRTVAVAEDASHDDDNDNNNNSTEPAWRVVALLTFLDPPRPDSGATLKKLNDNGVEV